MTRARFAALAAAAALLGSASTATASCTNDDDCGDNGACVDDKCICDVLYEGDVCEKKWDDDQSWNVLFSLFLWTEGLFFLAFGYFALYQLAESLKMTYQSQGSVARDTRQRQSAIADTYHTGLCEAWVIVLKDCWRLTLACCHDPPEYATATYRLKHTILRCVMVFCISQGLYCFNPYDANFPTSRLWEFFFYIGFPFISWAYFAIVSKWSQVQQMASGQTASIRFKSFPSKSEVALHAFQVVFAILATFEETMLDNKVDTRLPWAEYIHAFQTVYMLLLLFSLLGEVTLFMRYGRQIRRDLAETQRTLRETNKQSSTTAASKKQGNNAASDKIGQFLKYITLTFGLIFVGSCIFLVIPVEKWVVLFFWFFWKIVFYVLMWLLFKVVRLPPLEKMPAYGCFFRFLRSVNESGICACERGGAQGDSTQQEMPNATTNPVTANASSAAGGTSDQV